jgi:general stress protein 26
MTDAEGRTTFRELIRRTPVGMMTTFDAAGRLVSRPMRALLLDGSDDVWFLTQRRSATVSELSADPRAGVSFIGADGDYLSVAGRVTQPNEPGIIDQLWQPTYRAWFPGGREDPDLQVLRMEVECADYWDAPTSRAVRVLGMIRAVATGRPYETAERQHLLGDDQR